MSERLVVGRIAKAHGIRGELAVEVISDAEGRFAVGRVLEGPSGPLTIATTRPHQGRLLVTFEEVPDRNAAELLRGGLLTIDASEAAPLPEGRYYPHELENLDVRDTQGRALGTFVRVETSPAHDLWVVRTPAGREVLVPAVFERGVDREAGVITLEPPLGLFPEGT